MNIFKNVCHNSGDLSKPSYLKPGTGHQNHQDCSIQAKELVQVMRQERASIDVVLDITLQERKHQNMAVLETIVETILLCGRQNMAFQGHREDEKHDDMSSNWKFSCSKLLNYRVNGGNDALKAHCERAPKNACTYKSKTTQSELLNIIGDIILQRIVADIHQCGWWMVLCICR